MQQAEQQFTSSQRPPVEHWVHYFQVVGAFDSGRTTYALSRELPTESDGRRALNDLLSDFPKARLERHSCLFNDADPDARAFLRHLNSGVPARSPSMIMESWPGAVLQ